MKTPVNDLEKAFRAATRSESGLPEFLRRLREAELWFLMPFHPELEGEMQIQPGGAMSFETFMMEKGQMVPVFTSEEQLRYAIRVRKESARRYAVAQMKGVTLFQILAEQPCSVALNPHSELASAVFETVALRRLADGSILKPLENAGEDHGGGDVSDIMILDVANYPTRLVQPVFEYIRQHDVFLGAWIFGAGGPVTREQGNFRLALWMARRDAEAEQGLGLVVRAVQKQELHCSIVVMSTADKESQEWTRHVPPFYQRA